MSSRNIHGNPIANSNGEETVSSATMLGCLSVIIIVVAVLIVLGVRERAKFSQWKSDRETQNAKDRAEHKRIANRDEQRRQSAMSHTYYIAYHSEIYGERLLLGADTKQACVDSLLKDHANRKPVAACNADTTEIKIYHDERCTRYTVHLTHSGE